MKRKLMKMSLSRNQASLKSDHEDQIVEILQLSELVTLAGIDEIGNDWDLSTYLTKEANGT